MAEQGDATKVFKVPAVHRYLTMVETVGFVLIVSGLTSIVGFAGGNWVGVALVLGAFVPFSLVEWYFSWVGAITLELKTDSITFRTRKETVCVPYTRLRVMPFILGRFGPVFLQDATSGNRFVILRETESFPEIMHLLAERGVKDATD